MAKELDRRQLSDGGSIVIYDWMEVPDGRNLVRLDRDGNFIWRAMPPMKGQPGDDCWTRIARIDDETIIAYSFSTVECSISLQTGEVTPLRLMR